jgi:hypothetical protein
MAGSHDGIPWALPSVLQCAEGKGREHDPEKACPGFEPGVETGFPKKHAPTSSRVMPRQMREAAVDLSLK